jgi:hypothetical protein
MTARHVAPPKTTALAKPFFIFLLQAILRKCSDMEMLSKALVDAMRRMTCFYRSDLLQ